MEVSANFAFLKQEFPHAAESASYAERHVYGDPRASCFHARHALERLVKRVYKVDKTLNPPKVTNLDAYLSEPGFRAVVPEVVWQKAEYIRLAGNVAVHGNKAPPPEQALNVVQELAHVLYWAGRTYLRKGAESLHGKTFDESLVPTREPGAAPASVEELDGLKRRLDAAEDGRKEVEGELEALRERLAAIKAENETVPETRDWNESTTRRLLIDLALSVPAGRSIRNTTVSTKSPACRMPRGSVTPITSSGEMTASAAGGVWRRRKTTVDPAAGRQQAKLYAGLPGGHARPAPGHLLHNGYETYLWDDQACAPRAVAGFHKKDELASLLHRRVHREPLDVARVKNAIVERYYQKRAIGSIGERFSQARRKALLVMATGSGKTRVAVALVDLLQRAGWVKRALFLADRVSLVNQAVGAFKGPPAGVEPGEPGDGEGQGGPGLRLHLSDDDGADRRDDGHRGPLRGRAFRPRDHRRGAPFGVSEVPRHLSVLRLAAGGPDRDASGFRSTEHLRALRPGAGRAHRRVRTRDRGGGRLSRTAERFSRWISGFPRGHRLRLAQRGRAGTVGEPRLGRRRGR